MSLHPMDLLFADKPSLTWKLIKLDPAWRAAKWLAFDAALTFAAWHFFIRPREDPSGWLQIFSAVGATGILFAALTTATQQRADTRLQMSLPVTVRQVLLARWLALFALLWLPALTAAAVLAGLADDGASHLPFRAWSVAATLILCIQATIGELVVLQSALGILAPVWLLVGVLLQTHQTQDWPFQSELIGNLVMLCCWLAGAAVLVRIWQIAPGSFQSAPKSATRPAPLRIPAARLPHGAIRWLPIVRTFYPLWGLEFVFTFLALSFLGKDMFMYWIVMSGGGWTTIRAKARWLQPLPVRPRLLLYASLLPGIVSLAGGYLVGQRLSFVSARADDAAAKTQIVAVAFLAGWMMFTTLCQLFGDWRRVTRVLPYKIAGGLQVLPWLLGMTILLLKFPGKIDVIQRLTDLLPSNLPTLIALLAPILAVLYWCVDTVFSQIEVVGAPTPPGQT